MADTPANGTPDPATPDMEQASAAVAALRDLFATLVPPDTLTLTDAWGHEHTARAMLPARAQIIVMQHLQRLWDHDVPALAGATEDGLAGTVGAIVGLAADEVVLQGIVDAFTAAHPGVVVAAKGNASQAGMDPGALDAADLFPVEELVAGLAPFFIRFAARAANLLTQVTDQPMQVTAQA